MIFKFVGNKADVSLIIGLLSAYLEFINLNYAFFRLTKETGAFHQTWLSVSLYG